MRRRFLAGVAALSALAVLTGCVSIPTSGAVTTEQVEVEDPDSLLTLAAPPAVDATPAEIVAGFLRAGRGPQDDYSVARQYLTDELAGAWEPGGRTLISATPFEPVDLGDGAWSVTISAGVTVDGLGRYHTASPADSYDLDFTLVQDDDGQWRIDEAPDGTVVPADRFASIFAPYELYFFDPSFRYMVPDLRWYRSGSAAPDEVVAGLLAGPSDELGEGALVSAFPPELDGSVRIVDAVATVELGPGAGGAGGADLRRREAQLLQSLRTVESVREVVMTVGGVPVPVPDGGVQPTTNFLVGTDPIGGTENGRIGVLDADGLTALSGVGTGADGLGATAGSIVSRDRDRIVLRTPAGVTSVSADAEPVVLDSRAGLVAPTIDPLGWTWSVPADSPSQLTAYSATGTAVPVPGLSDDSRVLSIDVSRDGTRLLVVLDTAGGSRLLVAGIERDADLAPVGLLPPLELPTGDAMVLDAAWVDGLTIVTLSDGALMQVDAWEIGGQRTSLGVLTNGRQIVGGNGLDGTRVLDAEGNVLRPGRGTSWEDTGIDAVFLVTQQ